MFEIVLLVVIGFIGLIAAILGGIFLISDKISQPKKEIKNRINELEKEVKKIKKDKN